MLLWLHGDFYCIFFRVVNVCRALGCTMVVNSRQKTQADKLAPKTYTATLKLPLNFPKDRKTRPK